MKPATSQVGSLSPGKRVHRVLTVCQSTLQDETQAQTRMSQWWEGPHLDQARLDVHITGSLFNKLQSYFETLKMG